MNIEQLTIGEARAIAEIFGSGVAAKPTHPAIGRYSIIRTQNAGVHAGVVAAVDGQSVTLTDSRRIWSWTGALSCSEIAVAGITGGKVAVSVAEIFLAQAIEIIPTTPEAEKCLRNK